MTIATVAERGRGSIVCWSGLVTGGANVHVTRGWCCAELDREEVAIGAANVASDFFVEEVFLADMTVAPGLGAADDTVLDPTALHGGGSGFPFATDIAHEAGHD